MLRRTAKPYIGSRIMRMLSRNAVAVSTISVGMGAVALYVDAPMADISDGRYDGERRSEVFPEWLHDLLNETKITGVEILVKQLEERPKGTSVITVSNHSATVDDPAILATMMPWKFMWPRSGRWSLASQEYCYTKGKLVSAVFFGAKSLPVKRGAGVDHPMIRALYDKVEEGAWVHIFPEGKIVQDEALGGRPSPHREEIGRLKWGVGKLIARATTRPIVVPLYHYNMEKLMPQDDNNRLISVLPRINLNLGVIVGEPISFDDLFERYSNDRVIGASPWETQEREKALYSAITRRIENALLALENKTHCLQQ